MVVDRFFTWVAEATAEQRLRAVDALVSAHFDPRIGEDEREGLEAALTLVADDEDLAVRRRLAELLAEHDRAPRHLLLTLLEDHPSVAEPIAARSEALIDPELVDLVAHGCDELRRAIAGRRRVGPTVAVALAEAGDRAAATTLLANPGAELPPIALERVVERFGEFSDVRRALLDRPHVPITVRHRVLEKLAEAMENLVVVKSWMGAERAAATTRESREKATIALAAGATAAEAVVLVEHLRRTGQLTTRLMLRAACVGDMRFVEEALATLAEVPTTRVSALVADGRESAIRALYRRAAMPDRAYPAFLAAIEVHRELVSETGGLDGRPGDRARFSRRLVERVLTRMTEVGRRDADDLLVLLRRYAADAAREHVRHVVAERMADAGRALAAPVVAEAVEEETVPAVRPEVEAAAFGAVAAELGVAFEPEAPETVEAAHVAAPEWTLEAPGLFDHVTLDDLPPEWLVAEGEVPPEALWGEEDIEVRRAIVPDFRFDLDALRPAIEEPAEAVVAAPVEPLEGAVVEVAAVPASEEAIVAVETVVAPTESSPEVAAVAAEAVVADAEIVPEAAPAVASDPFIDELEASLDAILGPARRRPRDTALAA